MITEKNISKLIFIIPFLSILLASAIITTLIIKEDYKILKNETNQIRINHIKIEKKNLKSKIDQVVKFIKYSPTPDNLFLIQSSVLNFIENVISTKNNYLYIINDKGIVIYHPQIDVGTDASSLKDINGLSIASMLITKAKENPNGAYVTYYWNKPNKVGQEEKTAFVYYIKDWNWIIATGVYMNEVEKEILEKIKYEEKIINDKIINTIIIALSIIFSVFIFSYTISVFINKIFGKYKKSVEEKEKKLKELNLHLEKLANIEKEKRTLKEEELNTIYIDELTKLPNRIKLSKDLENISNQKLMILNINRFTDINNFYSHLVADELLKVIATFLTSLFKDNKTITIYKLPIDEFAIVSMSSSISSFEFIEICKSIIHNIEYNPFTIDNNEIIVSITGGISVDQNHPFINADTALKIAKEKNKDFIIYNEKDNIDTNFQNNIKMTKVLKDAINENRVVVFKQAIINNATNGICKYECLVRIKDVDGSIISPYLFLDIARKIKLYPKLTRIVIHKAFEHFKDKDCDFSINLTLDDILNKSTLKFIQHKLKSTNIAHRVIFEIVETEGIDNFEEVSLFIKEMKSYGCRIAIDDFGTGYSNFDYMMKLNVDFIKIDGAFIKNIDTDPQSQILTELIVTFAKKQNIKTIAEFVHSLAILEKVKSFDIDYSQGYYLGEPIECLENS